MNRLFFSRFMVEAPGIEDGKGAETPSNSWARDAARLLLGPSSSTSKNLATAECAASQPTPQQVLETLDPANPVHVLAVVAWLRGAK
jgi:hypothetical protein